MMPNKMQPITLDSTSSSYPHGIIIPPTPFWSSGYRWGASVSGKLSTSGCALPSTTAPTPVLTGICELQTTIPECGIIEFPIPTSPPTTSPYTLIVYASDMVVPSAYPLNLTGQRASWTVVYAGRWYRSFCLPFHIRVLANVVP